MDYLELLKILMKWSLENKEYDMTQFLFTDLNVGIPNKYLYQLSEKKYFTSLSSFEKNNECKNPEGMNEIIKYFSYSKYCFLEEWNTFGYKYNKK